MALAPYDEPGYKNDGDDLDNDLGGVQSTGNSRLRSSDNNFKFNPYGDDLGDVRNGERNGRHHQSDADGNDPKRLDRAALGDKEASSGKARGAAGLRAPDDSMFNEGGDDPRGPFKGARKKFRDSKARFANATNNKWFWGVGIGGSGLMLFMLFLVIIAGGLKLPGLTQSIAAYEFARVTTQLARGAQNITDEELAMSASDDSTYAELKEKFTAPLRAKAAAITDPAKQKYSDVRESTWGRMDAYRPNKVIETLGGDIDQGGNGLKLKYRTSKLTGREIFTGAELNGQEYPVKQVTGVAKYTPGLNRLLETKNSTSFLKNDFYPVLNETMKTNSTATIIRGRVADKILRQTGGSRLGWVLSKYKGMTPEEARIQVAKDTYNATEGKGSISAKESKPTTDKLAEATDDVAEEYNKEIHDSDTSTLKETIDNGGNSKAAEAAATKTLAQNFADKGLGLINPTYAIAAPLCMIYDGSVVRSGGTIDHQTSQQQNAFNKLAAEADQQKRGDTVDGDEGELATAVGATNDQIGDISQSIAYQRAAGANISTIDENTSESGADGGYTYDLFTALGVSPGGTTGKIANYVTENSCKALTSYTVAGGLAIVNLGAAILTLGGSEAAEEAAGQTASHFTGVYVKDLVKRIFAKQVVKKGTKEVERGALNRAQRFVFKQGVIVGATYGLTELAHMIVSSSSGQSNNGLAANTDLSNEADSGANIQAGELERQQLFGRPLTCSEIGESDNNDRQVVTAQNDSKSFSERYFALSNSSSLLSHAAITMDSKASTGTFSSLLTLGSSLLKPVTYIGTFLHLNGIARASNDPCTQHYGNVQFGWSNSEEGTITSDDSYKPLENRAIIDASNNEIAIAQKYAKCFGYKYDDSGNGDLDPTDEQGDLKEDPDASIGSLLADGPNGITRDQNGAVTNDGLCSPKNLGFGNNEFGPQMVFRWRLAMRYDTTLDHLINQQTVKD